MKREVTDVIRNERWCGGADGKQILWFEFILERSRLVIVYFVFKVRVQEANFG